MESSQKPKELYRGVTLSYDLIKSIRFYGVDIVPYYEPFIDELGRKTDKAGNEYGVYLSDNFQMSSGIYANTNDAVGIPVDKDFQMRVSGQPVMIRIPSVEVLYRINPENIDVHRPWITSYLNGTYHEDEWVTERIPASEYSVIRLTVGQDLLHDKENIDVSNIVEAERKVKEIIEKRKKQIEALYLELKKLPVSKRYQLDKTDIDIFKDVFGDNGVKYVDYGDVDLNSGNDYIKYLISENWKSNNETIDYSTLRLIESIKQKMPQGFTVDDLIQALNNEMGLISLSKDNFIQKKKMNNEVADTTNFDQRMARVSQLIDKLKNKIQTTNDDMRMEEEFGKAVGLPKRKLHKPMISESVKKAVIRHDQKQKLQEMNQQLLDEEQKRKEQNVTEHEDLIEEESLGMSM